IQGSIIAYLRVPAFIVTLGGYLVWRGSAWWVTAGRTVAPMDSTFQLMGGGPSGAIGAFWSWVVAIVACAAIVLAIYFGRRQRRRFHFPQRPRPAPPPGAPGAPAAAPAARAPHTRSLAPPNPGLSRADPSLAPAPPLNPRHAGREEDPPIVHLFDLLRILYNIRF